MFCANCGTQLVEGSKVCHNCGTRVEQDSAPANEYIRFDNVTKFSAMAIVGFVISLVGILIAAVPCGIIGLVFSSLGIRDAQVRRYRGNGLAISGLVISIIDIIIGIIYLAILYA